jgi:hypothetical protein
MIQCDGRISEVKWEWEWQVWILLIIEDVVENKEPQTTLPPSKTISLKYNTLSSQAGCAMQTMWISINCLTSIIFLIFDFINKK